MPSPRRKHPYYKVQTFEDRSMTCREKKVGFDTLGETQTHVATLDASIKWRIVYVNEDGYRDISASND